MGQRNEFNTEDLAPDSWVQAVEGVGAGAAIWRDASWGNNAAPSWELATPGDEVHAEAFYYSPANSERMESEFGPVAYVALTLYCDEAISAACTMEAATFVDVVKSAAAASYGDPLEALQQALHGLGLTQRILWDRVEDAPGAPSAH